MGSPATETPIVVPHSNIEQFELSNKVLKRVDAFSSQVRELFFIDNLARIQGDKEAALRSPLFSEYADKLQDSYVWIFFPWNGHLVKTVDKENYLRLKTNRNQDLITADEQNLLAKYRVAVFGLSVGSNIVTVLTQAGISNEITIADFDTLDTTNLNRILGGVHQVGLNKTVIAARRIYEDNPYATVRTYPSGADEAMLRDLLEKKLVDCIVDEIDHIPFKVKLRQLAIEFKVPVIMVTDNGDGVVLHVERYDLGHALIWGKAPSHFDELVRSPDMDKAAAGKIIMEDIVGGVSHVDPKMLASVKRTLAKELVSWSQLGSAAILGGVAITYMLKEIALGTSKELDIRAYISPRAVTWESHL